MKSPSRSPEQTNGAPPTGNGAVHSWHSFLLACARYQEPSKAPQKPIDELRIFDNSLHHVDEHIRVLAQSIGGWPGRYETYLDLRMSSFAALAAKENPDLLELLKRDAETFASADPSQLAGIAELLEQLFRSQEPAESKALLRRLEQLPRQAVIEAWYRPTAGFELWAEAVATGARAREREQWSSIRAGGYARLLKQLATDEELAANRADAEPLQRRLSAASQELLAHLRGEAGLSAEAIEALHALEPVKTPPKDDAPSRWRTTLLRVSTELAEMADVQGGDLLNAFVVELAKACQCEFCDFASVEGSQLRPTAISDPASELRELPEKRYHRAEGIAGSALLLLASSERRWVGTNDLATDPRQSLYHTRWWTKATNYPIHDYWVFPVFRHDGSCFGAFRVFNRLRSCWENGTPWSDGMLWELREVATWFEAAILPRLGETKVVPRTVAETAHSAAVQHLKAELGLKWIDEDFLVRLITHATQVTHRRVETLSLGCCIGVFAKPSSVLTHSTPYYAAGEVLFDTEDSSQHLEDAGLAYAKINPAAGMFVFDSTGRGHGVINLSASDPDDDGAPLLGLSRQHPQSLLIFLDRGQDCIRIVADGEIAGDYYLSEASGEWTLRMCRQLVERAVKAAPTALTPGDVREVFKRAVDLSYKRIGAMLILGDGTPEHTAYEHETVLTDVNLRSLSPSEFADMAGADGAVRIEPVQGVTAIGALVRTKFSPDPHLEGRPEGSRHSSAAAFSEMAPNHMVFVVSENRALTVMVNGESVIEPPLRQAG
jgi:DisA bacterial checkpoint controller nucleotide-binding